MIGVLRVVQHHAWLVAGQLVGLAPHDNLKTQTATMHMLCECRGAWPRNAAATNLVTIPVKPHRTPPSHRSRASHDHIDATTTTAA